jgi:methyl-accepting chemotaxis protein
MATKDNRLDRVIGALEATNDYIKASLKENKEEIKQVRNAIESIHQNLNQLSNLDSKFQNYENLTIKIQAKIEEQQDNINTLTDNVQDISERLESQKKLRWLMVGAFFTIAANVIVLIINIFYKVLIARFFGI